MLVYSDILGSIYTNCYYALNELTKECIIVDPAADAAKIEARLAKLEAKPVAILLTHGHFDHVMAVNELRSKFDIKVYACEKEEGLLTGAARNLSSVFGFSYKTYADIYLKNGDEISLAGFNILCIHTPGHTSGSMCYYFPEEDVVFTGDTLFNLSVGRTDFPTGSASELVKSIREKLMILPESTVVYPGHDASTTIGYEKANNPCF